MRYNEIYTVSCFRRRPHEYNKICRFRPNSCGNRIYCYYAVEMSGTESIVAEPLKNADNKLPAADVWSRIKCILGGIHVEPLVCFYIMSRTLMLLPTQNLSLQKACRVNLNLSDETCTALDNASGRDDNSSSAHKADEVATQQLVADMFLWQLVIQSSVPCALAIFIGSWSDRNRKRVPCMVLPIVSELVRVIGLLACVYYFYELPVDAVGLVEAIPTSLAGGRMVLFNALFSYVADVTNVSVLPAVRNRPGTRHAPVSIPKIITRRLNAIIVFS